MADAPVPNESLVKKEPDLPAEDPLVSRTSSGWMLISALLLTLSIVWALFDEAFYQRPWKGMQREFVARYTRYLDSIRERSGQSEAQIKESAEYQQLEDAENAANEQVKEEVAQIDAEVRTAQRILDAVTDPFQNQRGRLTVINYDIEVAKNDSSKAHHRRRAEDLRARKVSVDIPTADGKSVETRSLNYAELEKVYEEQREAKASKLARKAELLKTPSELRKKKDDYLKNQLIGFGPSGIDGFKTKMENYDYSILGHQISVTAYNIVDRCEVCHAGIREPLELRPADLAPDKPGGTPDSYARAFVSHPNKEIFQVHSPEKFGCASCHWGNGRATTSERKGHGRHRFWLWPMFEKENMEAGCQQCHAKDRVTQGANTLNLGRDLFVQRGCMGCHRYEGFDRETDALANARTTISQLQEQIVQNEKQMRADQERSGQLPEGSDQEVQRLLAHAEGLKVTNSLLAARIDQLSVQAKYLMQDQKKVGPNLKDVRVKLRKEWVPVWLEDPWAFRPNTKMPKFWRFDRGGADGQGKMRDPDGADQVKAISAYLWQESFDSRVPQQERGDAGRGKNLFENRGCLACHSVGDSSSSVGGDFAANLQRVGEKASFDYIVRWIYNPRERIAPYCPKEKRDLTAEDYSKKGLPFVFDTELHSKCPNDGTELQVQNMTVMPNFRLSEVEARDIATYLFSLSAPPSYADASFMDDPGLKEKGRALIKQYGCAGCHEIKGFEEEQRIGKELTVEGATPIERLDFALQTHHAEYGEDPLELRKGTADEHKPWYNHKGFFERKIAQPAIYDEGKEKEQKDRLKMPQPNLEMKPEWRVALTTFLLGSVGTEGSNVPASLFYTPQDQRRQDIQNGWWVVKKYNCMGCHQMQVGQRSTVMDLPMFAEAKDLLPPNLSSEGARVDPAWLLRFLQDPSLSGERTPAQAQQIASLANGSQPSASPQPGSSTAPAATSNTGPRLKPQPGQNRNGIRPYINFRMPTFNFSPNELQILVRFFMAMSGQIDPYIKEPLMPLTAEERMTARQMFTSGTPCLKCHVTGDPVRDASAIAPNFLLASERLKPDWTFRWLLDPAQISPGTAMPTGLFKKEGDRWVLNLPNPPPSANAYHQDHARLLVRYMFQMTPEEQRALLATAPATPVTAAAPAQHHARGKRKRLNRHHGRAALKRPWRQAAAAIKVKLAKI